MSLYNAKKAAAAPENDFSPVPQGVYKVMFSDVFLKDTQKGGTMVNLKMQIVEGKYSNRFIFDRLNIICSGSEVAEAIAHKNLASICEQLGFDPEELTDEAVLQEKLTMGVISVDIKIEDNTYNGETKKQNAVKSYAPKGATTNTPTNSQGAVQSSPYGDEAPF